MPENMENDRPLLGPLLQAPEARQRRQRALLVSMATQGALILLVTLWPFTPVVPYHPPDVTVVPLVWPTLSVPVPPVRARVQLHLPPRPRPRPVAAPKPLWRPVASVPNSTPHRPALRNEPGPVQLQPLTPVMESSPLPRFAAPSIGAEPVLLDRFAAAAAATAPPAAGALKASGFGGRQTEPVTAQAHAEVQPSGFAAASRTTAAGSGASVHTGNFGGAGAAPSSESGDAAGSVANAGFNLTALPAPPGPARTASLPPAYIPVEILFKPVPVYSAEGRQLGIQGEVVLAVLFQIDGHLRVARVVQGLGHGLDQAAVLAAQQIRFRPARRNGAPIETAALIRVTFQLAQ